MPVPRMTGALRARITSDKKPDGTITRETVTAVSGDGGMPNNTYQVLGVWVPGRDTVVKVGEVVYVEWRNNNPYRIIEYDVRRGSTRAHGGGEIKGVVEEVFLAPSAAAGGTVTVWFRNYDQVTELRYNDAPGTRVYTDWGGKVAQTVKWGVNRDVFGVLVGAVGQEVIHVYRIVRGGNAPSNPTAGNVKIIASGVKTKITEKIGSYTLSTIGPLPICSPAIHIKRDSIEPYVLLVWHPTGPAGTPDAMFDFVLSEFHRDSGTNANTADVDRSLTINLTGTQVPGTGAITFTNGAPIAASQIVVPHGIPDSSYSAALDDWAIDELNHPVYSVKVTFTDFGMWQGNSQTGLTGAYHLLGEGTLTNIGLCFVTLCPALDDNVGIMDFMDHGNPSGIISTHVYEQHIVVIDAATATIKWKTLVDNVTLQMQESTNGQSPYRLEKNTNMPASPDQCGAPNSPGGPGGWRSTNPFSPAAIQAVLDEGNMGDLGLFKEEDSFFDPLLSFGPDLPNGNDPTPGTPTRRVTTRVHANFTGYDREWFDFFGQQCGFFIAQEHVVQANWSLDVTEVLRRYDVNVDVKPFVTSTGLRWFVTVNRVAQRPNHGDKNLSSDMHSYGVFIVNATGGLVGTVRPYTDITDLAANSPTITFITANDRHVIWKETMGQTVTWYTANYTTGIIQNCGSKPPTTLYALAPDLLFSDSEEKPKAIYFVKGWDPGTHVIDPTFNDGVTGFPKKDSVLGDAGFLKDLGKVSATMPDYHVIVDTTLLPVKYRT